MIFVSAVETFKVETVSSTEVKQSISPYLL